MDYPKGFFDLNLRFAKKVAEVSSQSFDLALLHYTNLYIRFGLGRDFDPANPIWQEFVAGLHHTDDLGEWTYRFYLNRQASIRPPTVDGSFGCFLYTRLDDGRIRLHFHNADGPAHSPLSRSRMNLRLAELKALFAHLKSVAADSATVIGASWLYNLPAYRRLFPPAYLATAQESDNDFAYLPLWGQFVDHTGRLKVELVTEFLKRLEVQQSEQGLIDCFPFKVLYLESPIEEFYRFYGV